MVTSKEPDLMSACAEIIIDRLYELALCDNRIMVCNWCAYAALAAYKAYNELSGESYLPTLEECFSGVAIHKEWTNYPKWRILKSMHEYHWSRANSPEWEAEYSSYFSIVAINLDGIWLGQ